MTTAKELGHQLVKACLYDVEWQMLRMSFLGTWSLGKQEVLANITSLHNYINHADNNRERAFREWRALNLLNAVKLGYSQGAALGRPVPVFAEYIYEVCEYLNPLSCDPGMWTAADWEWDIVVQALQDKKMYSTQELRSLKGNLSNRIGISRRRGLNAYKTRIELMYFLGLLEKELEERRRLTLSPDVQDVIKRARLGEKHA